MACAIALVPSKPTSVAFAATEFTLATLVATVLTSAIFLVVPPVPAVPSVPFISVFTSVESPATAATSLDIPATVAELVLSAEVSHVFSRYVLVTASSFAVGAATCVILRLVVVPGWYASNTFVPVL